MLKAKRANPAPLLALAAAAALPLLFVPVACGGGEKAPPVSPTASASAPPAVSTSASAAPSTAPSTAMLAGPTALASVAPPPVPTSTVATTKVDASWAGCHQSFKANRKDVMKDVAAMAKACEKVTAMKPLGKPLTGTQADSALAQSFPLDAKAGHCYRVYAQAADGIQDLDVFIKDSANVIVGQDSTDDPSPVVLEDGAVCFSKADKASVVVSVGMGKGAWALEIWERQQ
jgi:hypothetical protein